MRKLIGLLVLMSLCVPVFGVNAQDAEVESIALVFDSEIDYFAAVAESAQAAADEQGVTLVTVATVEEAVEAGVHAIVLVPNGTEADQEAIMAANEAEIPLYVLGDYIAASEDIEVAGVIGVTPAAQGEFAGTTICETLSNAGKVLEITDFGAEADEALLERQTSLQETLAAECAAVTVTTLDVSDLEGQALNAKLVEQLRSLRPNLVIGYSDSTVLGAASASLAARLRNTSVVGFGLSNEIVTALTNGNIALTLVADPLELGAATVAYVLSPDDAEALEIAPVSLSNRSLTITRPCQGANC